MKKVSGFDDTIAWYDANADQYAKNIQGFSSIDLLDRFAKAVRKGGKVLDAGCAAGRDSRLLKNRGLEPVGIDLSKSLLKVAKQDHPDIKFRYGNLLRLPFDDRVFDGVWAHASLLHFEKIEDVIKALREFNRVLKNDGKLHIFVKQQKGKEKTSVVSDKLSGHDRFFQWFTKIEIKNLLAKTGFVTIKLEDNYKDPAERKEVKWIVALAKKINTST